LILEKFFKNLVFLSKFVVIFFVNIIFKKLNI
jgi:hypothetical protein